MEPPSDILRNLVREVKINGKKYGINIDDTNNIIFWTTLIIGTVFFLYFLLLFTNSFRKKKKKKQEIALLLGPCDSGKTTFLFQLKTGKTCRTVTSMKENKAIVFSNYNKKRKCIHVVDYPGHPKLAHSLNKYLEIAKVIIYILDSSDKQSLKHVAERLYDLFSNKIVINKRIPILIVCNKMDLCNARPKQVIKKNLEQEIEILKISRNTMLDEEEKDYDNQEEEYWKTSSDFFKFEMTPCEIEICSASVKNGNVDEIMDFVDKFF